MHTLHCVQNWIVTRGNGPCSIAYGVLSGWPEYRDQAVRSRFTLLLITVG